MANFYLTPTGAGAMDGSDWDNAFSMSEFTTWINSAANPGDTCYIYSGTYTVSTIINTARHGTFSAMVRLLGVQDQGTLAEAFGDNRPLFECTSTTYIYLGSYYYTRGIRIYKPSQGVYAIRPGGYNTVINVRSEASFYSPMYALGNSILIDVEIVMTGATQTGLVLGAYCQAYNCVAEAQGGRAYHIDAGGCFLVGCVAKTTSSGTGFYIRVAGDFMLYNCTLDGHSIGVDIEQASSRLSFINCTVSNCTTGFNVKSGSTDLMRLYYSNFYNNTTDVANVTKDSGCVAYNPDFENSSNYDYRLKTSSALRNIGKNLNLWIGS